MTAQEIKDGMTKGEWTSVQYANYHLLQTDCFYGSPCLLNEEETKEAGINAEAATTSVNCTYGAGYDPTKVLSIVQQTQWLLDEMLNSGALIDQRAQLQQLLNEAKLK